MTGRPQHHARVVPLRTTEQPEPLWRDLVGQVLRDERLDRDLTLQQVADAAGISLPYLSEVERGRKEASSEVLAAAARALGLDLADLLALSHRRLVRLSRARVAAAAPGRAEARASVLALAA